MITKLFCQNLQINVLILSFLLTFSSVAFSQNEFVTTWKTDNPGVSNSTSITIPTTGTGYNYEVDWTFDGTFNAEDSGVMGDITHDYGVVGTYTVAIQGTFPRIFFDFNNTDYQKIMSIEQWGTNAWTSMAGAFSGCENLVYNATDVPDLSGVLDVSDMFNYCLAFNGDLNNWDVSNVTNMNSMFTDCSSFNSNLNNWNVSNVKDMHSMFAYSAFNGDLSSWNVSLVEDMSWMFEYNTAFNGDISNWNVSKVTAMSSMFANSVFNGNISTWNVGMVADFDYMFANSPFDGDLSNWDVSSADYLSFMFANTTFNGDLSNWDISNARYLDGMFSGDTAFDGDLSGWDISTVDTMSEMFYGVTLSTTNYDNILIGWSTLSAGETQIPIEVEFDAGNSTYCNGESAHNLLDNDYLWSIYDAGKDCSGLGTNDYNLNASLRIYPNPAKNALHIASGNILEHITITDLSGKIVLDIDETKHNDQENISVANLNSGLYFLNVYSDTGHLTKKFIKY